jgi:hypothetical protein
MLGHYSLQVILAQAHSAGATQIATTLLAGMLAIVTLF